MPLTQCHKALPLSLLIALLSGCSGGAGDPPTQPPPGTNHNPTVNLTLDKAHLAYGETGQLSVSATDVDGDQATFNWAAVRGTVSSSGPSATSAILTAGQQWGAVTVTVTASDGKGGSAQATAQSYIRNPVPPSLELTRFGGHLTLWVGRFHDVQAEEVRTPPSRIPRSSVVA